MATAVTWTAAQKFRVGRPITYPIATSAFTDADAGDSCTYTATDLPAGIVVSGTDITGTASTVATIATVSYTCTDIYGMAITNVPFTIDVIANVRPNVSTAIPDLELKITDTDSSIIVNTHFADSESDALTNSCVNNDGSPLVAPFSYTPGTGNAFTVGALVAGNRGYHYFICTACDNTDCVSSSFRVEVNTPPAFMGTPYTPYPLEI
ncbi:hypothetical protein COB52_05500 [Candidatus Kaiserbacteria bacterium]|nr:MAG: hypothetical protein COB52_05500 [Candidatus Kaiserbacteria bacterium]